MFCRLKDYRRIATRYDKLADNCLAAIYIVASVTCWLRVRTLGEIVQFSRNQMLHRVECVAVDPDDGRYQFSFDALAHVRGI